MAAGGLSGAVFNGAKEVALDAFLDRRIGFLDMSRLVADALDALGPAAAAATAGISLQDVMGYDRQTREFGRVWVERHG